MKIMIVGTVPYNTSGPSRAFESYFHGIDSNSLAQVFSNPNIPKKGHCSTLYQITDRRLLKRWISKKEETGRVFDIDELTDMDDNFIYFQNDTNVIYSHLQKIGAKHSPLTHLLRKLLWKKRYWCTSKFNKWLDSFSPDCVFISFSDDFFIHDIAKYISKRFDIPIVFTISDDYIFNGRISFSPFYYIYRVLYKNCVKETLSRSQFGVYICDKIRDKYNAVYNLKGETVYLTSNIKRRIFRPIPKNPVVRYFGNIMLDRYKSIVDIANALHAINPMIIIEVYAGHVPKSIKSEIESCKSMKLMGFIPYSEVVKLTNESDIILVTEGFTKYNIRSTRYSLSTKAADSLASGVNVFAYGSLECGLIDYLHNNDACMVCYNQKLLQETLQEFINNVSLQKYYYNQSKKVYDMNHNLEVSSNITLRMIREAVDNWKE